MLETGIFISLQVGAFSTNPQPDPGTTTTADVKYIDSTITADGKITAQNQATLHFQTGGKLVSLPFKEGDRVSQGQTIAQLDTYALQKQLSQALNTYRSTRNTFDQTQQNAQDNVLQNQQKPLLPAPNTDQGNAINDAVKRIVDQNQATLDNSVINVELANYAVQLSTIVSPLTGIIMQEDVTVPNVNVTPQTSFTVADPSTVVFRANVPASDIDYIAEGDNAEIAIDGRQNRINGTIVKIFPSKVQLANGESVYQVDIQSNELTNTGKLDQSGTAIIMTHNENVTLVPAWAVLGGKYIWVYNNGETLLRTVTIGKTHGNQTEITSGLMPQDRVIVDPKSIPAKQYQML